METKSIITQKYVNCYGYTDITPYEVVRVISEKTIEVREMDCKLTEASKQAMQESFVPGGFCGHTDNSLQDWIIASNPNHAVIRLYLHKDGCYYGFSGKGRLSDFPIKHYDYNF